MDTTQGRDWLDMRPAHFDKSLMSRSAQRAAADQGLFDLADVAAVMPRKTKPKAPQLDGQFDLFGEAGQ
jgi:hypothetical protein